MELRCKLDFALLHTYTQNGRFMWKEYETYILKPHFKILQNLIEKYLKKKWKT